jgi:hypothetical protein
MQFIYERFDTLSIMPYASHFANYHFGGAAVDQSVGIRQLRLAPIDKHPHNH